MNVMNMDFGANKIPIEVIKKEAFRGTHFRDIYSGINGKWYRKPLKEFDELKNIDKNIIAQFIMMLELINKKLNVEHN